MQSEVQQPIAISRQNKEGSDCLSALFDCPVDTDLFPRQGKTKVSVVVEFMRIEGACVGISL